MRDWVKDYKKSKDWREFLKHLEQYDWNEMAKQHHGDLSFSPKETQNHISQSQK